MFRRKFLIASTIFGLSSYLKAKELYPFKKSFSKINPIIIAVQKHMFPEQSLSPSVIHANRFLLETITQKNYDKDIRIFIFEGAKELIHKEKAFLSLPHKEKENALRAYENTEYGSAWLSRIMILTLEGLLSDPIYGANLKESGWKALDSFGGYPRPKSRYLENV